MRFVLKEVSKVRGQQTSEGRKELAIVNKAMEFLMVDKSSKWYFTVLFQLEMSFSGKTRLCRISLVGRILLGKIILTLPHFINLTL